MRGEKVITKLPKVSYTCNYDAVMDLAEKHRMNLISAIRNMSATEIYKLHDSWLHMKEKDHFRVLNESVNSHRRRKDDI